ncbi:hypothetical protein [Komagataeibacter sp. FXV3]|uniref:hypothetical protein n=1 Tax=Komagataeibacter sp. FXV3 TaxID=2608998 RepID=UPI00187B39CD|nr:hypothetical protein [Komagataeibacter sp. FXV3]
MPQVKHQFAPHAMRWHRWGTGWMGRGATGHSLPDTPGETTAGVVGLAACGNEDC